MWQLLISMLVWHTKKISWYPIFIVIFNHGRLNSLIQLVFGLNIPWNERKPMLKTTDWLWGILKIAGTVVSHELIRCSKRIGTRKFHIALKWRAGRCVLYAKLNLQPRSMTSMVVAHCYSGFPHHHLQVHCMASHHYHHWKPLSWSRNGRGTGRVDGWGWGGREEMGVDRTGGMGATSLTNSWY